MTLLACVVVICPSICALGETTVGEMVYNAFIRVLFRAHEDQASRFASETAIRLVYQTTHCSKVWGQPLSLKTEKMNGWTTRARAKELTFSCNNEVSINDWGWRGVQRCRGRADRGHTPS